MRVVVRRHFQRNKITDICFAVFVFCVFCLLACQLQFQQAVEFFKEAGAITNNDMVIKAGYVGIGQPYAVTVDRDTGQRSEHFVLREDEDIL